MQEKLSSNQLITLAEEVVLRQVTTPDKISMLVKLGLHCRTGINWRTVLHSDASSRQVWVWLETHAIAMDAVMAMTSEFAARAGIIDESVYKLLDDSISWSATSKALPTEITQMTAQQGTYATILKTNPWVLFLYMLSMSAIVQRLIGLAPGRQARQALEETVAAEEVKQ